MPEVQNVGAIDYAQYQPSQSQQEVIGEDYNAQPEVYDESYVQMQAANKSRMGATIVAGLIATGIGVGGYLIGKHGVKGDEVVKKELETLKKELTDLKSSEAVKNYDKLKQSAEEVEKFVEEKSWYNFFGVKDKIKNAFSFLKEDSKKVAEDATQTADKAKDSAEDAAKKAVDEAKEGAENAA